MGLTTQATHVHIFISHRATIANSYAVIMIVFETILLGAKFATKSLQIPVPCALSAWQIPRFCIKLLCCSSVGKW